VRVDLALMGVWLVPIVASLHLKEVQRAQPAPQASNSEGADFWGRTEDEDQLFFPLLDESDIPIEHREGDGASEGAHEEHVTPPPWHSEHSEPEAHGGHTSVAERVEEEAAHTEHGGAPNTEEELEDHAHEPLAGHATTTHAAEHGEHGGHGGGDHDDHGEGRTGEVIGKMLLGAVAFQMAIFYLVNNSDPDIRRYAWTTVGTTIAIFSAVLIYGACHELLDAYTEEGYNKVTVATVHCVFWFIVTEMVLLIIAKWADAYVDSLPKKPLISVTKPQSSPRSSPHSSSLGESPLKRSEVSAILDMKCWGGFLGHVTAFAAITVYMQVQRRLHHAIGASGVFVIPVIAVLIFVVLFFVTGRIRLAIEELDGGETKSDEIWEDVAQEVENDVFSICLSFLLAECVFYLIEGSEYRVRHAYHSGAQIAACWAAAAVFAVLMIGTSYARVVANRIHKKRRIGIGRRRFLEILQSLFAFGFAWCGLAAVSWKCDHIREFYGWTHIWTEVTVAMLIALSSTAAIFIIDKIADMEAVGQEIEGCIRESVMAFGFLIGFSWEHAFHKSIEDITATFPEYEGYEVSKSVQCFVLCVCVVAIVFPAYRWYIVPTVYRLSEQKEDGGRLSAPPTAR
jgi:hypothetical protein